MHVFVWEQIVGLYYRTAKWMFTKLGRDEVFMLREGSRAMPNRPRGGGGGGGGVGDRKATATNQIHGNDLEACVMDCCCFWFHPVV